MIDSVLDFGPHFNQDPGVQVDLIYKRTHDIWVICEIKFSKEPISYKIIKEVGLKIEKLPLPKGHTVEKMLIAPMGADPILLDSNYFDYIVDLNMLLKK